MTGTEMFDAIAHIDENLIEGCIARMKARASEKRALAAAEAAESGKKPSAFRRAAIACTVLAAVAVLAFGLVSILHIGGKKPAPIEPAPTKTANEGTEIPFRYSVALVFDNEESLKFKEYGPEDFPGIDCTEVVNVTQALENSIRDLVERGVNDPDVQEFCKNLRIMLSDPSEENAEKCAAKLREMEHVISAEPFLEPYDVLINGFRCRIEDTILPVEGRIQVADRVFLYPPSGFHINLTNEEDGAVYDLSYAYENGLISYDDLSELYFIHMEYVIRKGHYSEETYKKEAYVHYAFINDCEIGFSHEETGGIEVKEAAGSKFLFVHPFTIAVRKNGGEDILDITEACEAGLLTAEEVAEAARLHREFVISTYEFGEELYAELSVEPTAAPTAEPARTTSFDFSACSEKILSLTPYIADIQPELPEDAPEDVILYIDNSVGGDVTNLSARWIASDGHYLCIYDMRCCLTVFKDGAFLYRKFAYMGMGAADAGACLTEGRLYSAEAVVDVKTGEVIAQLKMREPCEDWIIAVRNKDGRPVLITERMDGDQICFDRYELGDDNAWALAGEYLRVSEKSGSDENGNAVIECGGESYTIEGMEPFPEGRVTIELLGIDSSGAVVLNVGFGWIVRCEKGYSAAKTMTLPFDPTALWDPDLFFDLLPDGTIYMGVPLKEAFEVYRISFEGEESSPEPIEGTEPTAVPTEESDASKLRAFFELADENGVKNGEKLFPDYDPDKTVTWKNPRMDPGALSWDKYGNLTGLILNSCRDISEACELAGVLDLRGFAELTNIKITNTVAVRIINVSDCPKLEKFEAYGKYDELYFSAALPPENFSFSPKNMLECRFTEMSDVLLLAPNDFACTPCFWGFRNQGDESARMFIGCDVSDPYTFEGWYDANGELYSAESRVSLAEAEPPAGGDWILAARSKDKEPYYREYEGVLPTASDMLVSLENGVPAEFDIDFDGLPDTLTASMTEYASYDREFAVTIVRGASPNEPFTFSIRGDSNLFAVYVMDCDITDDRLDIIFSAGGDVAEQIESLHAFRVDPEGEGILDICFEYANGEIFTGSRGMFAERGVFDPTEGIPVMVFTDLLDTQGIVGRFTVTNEGLMLISPFSFYPDGPDTRFFRELERSMDVTVMNDGMPGEKITLKKGQVFAAHQTDLWSWLDLILGDGRIVRAELDTRYTGYRINGIEQDEYCEIHYAG